LSTQRPALSAAAPRHTGPPLGGPVYIRSGAVGRCVISPCGQGETGPRVDSGTVRAVRYGQGMFEDLFGCDVDELDAAAVLTAARVPAGDAQVWKARKIARASRALPEQAAALVDRRVAAIVNTVTPVRLATIVDAALREADPAAARAAAEDHARARGVWVKR